MDSSEVLREAIDKVGVKSVASDMRLSTSLIYKWCQPNDRPDDSGADNPLDRLLKLYECTGDIRIVSWLCQQADGYFARNPESGKPVDSSIFDSTQSILKEFSQLLEVVSESYANDKAIDLKEADKIRTAWDDLKTVTESFVRACESGTFTEKK